MNITKFFCHSGIWNVAGIRLREEGLDTVCPPNIGHFKNANAPGGSIMSVEQSAPYVKITEQQYTLLQKAYDHFNARLFGGQLANALLTLHRHRTAEGYFSPEKFTEVGTGVVLHEIALNPDCITKNFSAVWVLYVLVHEQAHLWQHDFGKHKSRNGYHNREWADKMEEIGLMPFAIKRDEEESGARTGYSQLNRLY